MYRNKRIKKEIGRDQDEILNSINVYFDVSYRKPLLYEFV